MSLNLREFSGVPMKLILKIDGVKGFLDKNSRQSAGKRFYALECAKENRDGDGLWV
jgi:hypothetical protein